jgi:hypothetical protein
MFGLLLTLTTPTPFPFLSPSSLPVSLTPSLPSRNFFALISNFVEERVKTIMRRTKGFC